MTWSHYDMRQHLGYRHSFQMLFNFDLQEESLIPVISRAVVIISNGICANSNQTTLYITDSSATNAFPVLDGGADETGVPAIHIRSRQ
jgi:sugar lactone lactonase YvrE